MATIPFMRPPKLNETYQVGDIVEAFCDHDEGDQRIKGWLRGTVVQIDAKLVAVQFRSDVYLTGGWMIPDHILWYPESSSQIRKKQ